MTYMSFPRIRPTPTEPTTAVFHAPLPPPVATVMPPPVGATPPPISSPTAARQSGPFPAATCRTVGQLRDRFVRGFAVFTGLLFVLTLSGVAGRFNERRQSEIGNADREVLSVSRRPDDRRDATLVDPVGGEQATPPPPALQRTAVLDVADATQAEVLPSTAGAARRPAPAPVTPDAANSPEASPSAVRTGTATSRNTSVVSVSETAIAPIDPPGSLHQPDTPPPVTRELRTLGTALEWAETPDQALQLAREQGKLVFLIQVSGNFAREEFT